MINLDRKICHDILKITKSYDDQIFFDPSLGCFSFWGSASSEETNLVPSIPISEISSSIQRLVDKGLIRKIRGVFGGGIIFSITPELLHAKAFWFDRVTKKFLAGFASGVATSVAAGMIIHFFTGLF